MGVRLAQTAVDLGIVISDSQRSLDFYCGLLGLEHVVDTPLPGGIEGTMHRVQCGDSLLKLVKLADNPPPGVGGGLMGALGLRYLTLRVSNLDEMAADVAQAGVKVVVPVTAIATGRILVVEDPDGNWVEFVEYTP